MPRLTPGLGLDLLQGLGGSSHDKNRFTRFSLTLVEFDWHAPVGAFELGLGGGYGYYLFDGPNFDSGSGHGGEFVGLINYTVFLTDAWFLRFYTAFTGPQTMWVGSIFKL